jgi:hypothetical protein
VAQPLLKILDWGPIIERKPEKATPCPAPVCHLAVFLKNLLRKRHCACIIFAILQL